MKGHILQITPDQVNILYQNVQRNFLRKLKNNLNRQQTLEMIVLFFFWEEWECGRFCMGTAVSGLNIILNPKKYYICHFMGYNLH